MATEIYKLKITTKHIKPSIWRMVLIPANANFLDLHDIIMKLFGFDNTHLFAFYPGNNLASSISYGESGSKNAANTKLYQQFQNVEKLNYTYDFGDNWQFIIKLEKTLPRKKNAIYPQCLKAKGGMLLEDCGGEYSYELITRWCRAKTPENRDALIEHYGHDEVLDWYSNFNPDYFDFTEVKFNHNL